MDYAGAKFTPPPYKRMPDMDARMVSVLRSRFVNPLNAGRPPATETPPAETPAGPEVASPMDEFMRGNLRLGLSQGMEDFDIASAVRKTPAELRPPMKGRMA